jgi:hypothetical protein
VNDFLSDESGAPEKSYRGTASELSVPQSPFIEVRDHTVQISLFPSRITIRS